MKNLTENHLTTLGTDQFYEHTRMMTLKIKDILKGGCIMGVLFEGLTVGSFIVFSLFVAIMLGVNDATR